MADSKQGNNEQRQTQLLQNYLDDLLSDNDSGDEISVVNKTEAFAKTPTPEQQENNIDTGVNFDVNIGHIELKSKTVNSEDHLRDQMPNSETETETRVATKLETKSQVKAPPLPFVDAGERLKVLEEQKRRKLQSMLSQPLAKATLDSQLSRFETFNKKTLQPSINENPSVSEVRSSLVDPELTVESSLNSDFKTTQNTGAEIASVLKWQKNGRPVWAQREFEILMFEVNGLTLAVPLVALGQIVPLTDKLAPVFGQTDWFMGILPNKLGDIRVVNTALFVMPEKYNPQIASAAAYVITIDGHRWGLAVDHVKQAFKLEPDAVKWRGERSKRAWLAGTVKEKMCALIDVPQMAIQLDGSDKNLHSNESID